MVTGADIKEPGKNPMHTPEVCAAHKVLFYVFFYKIADHCIVLKAMDFEMNFKAQTVVVDSELCYDSVNVLSGDVGSPATTV